MAAMTVRYNYIYLLAGLLVLVMVIPIVQSFEDFGLKLLSQLSFIAVQMFGIWSLTSQRKWFLFGAVLLVLAAAFAVLNITLGLEFALFLKRVVVLLFCLVTVVLALRDVLFGRPVDGNKLIGAICIYMLLGVIWALLYLILETAIPGSFAGANEWGPATENWTYLYFSFVTLTTLGFGDISPVNSAAAALVYVEAICGQMYLAILVAGLVGAAIVDCRGKPGD